MQTASRAIARRQTPTTPHTDPQRRETETVRFLIPVGASPACCPSRYVLCEFPRRFSAPGEFERFAAMSLNTAHVQGGGCLIHAGEW